MPSWLVLPLLAAFLPQPQDVVIEGVVTNAAGAPIAGATINAMPTDVAVSAVDGRFTIKNPSEVVRFTSDGYVPVTRTRVALKANPTVVLHAATGGPRRLPTCSGLDTQPGVGLLRVPTPGDARRTRVDDDDDSVSEFWRVRKAYLHHGQGPTWSWGLPPSFVLARLKALDERDVRLPMTPIADAPTAHLVADVKGIYPDGKRYRFVGKLGETFRYDRASAKDAAFFDRMLDAMCYVEAEPSPPARR